MTVEYLEKVIAGCKTDNQVKATLNKAGIKYKQDPYSEINGKQYMSLHIQDIFRIYKNTRNEYKVQKMIPYEMKYSGVPVFFDSFDKVF